jgi:peptide/nickel transport system permease protein
MNNLRKRLREIRRYPSLAAGLILLIGMVALSIYAVVAIPYSEAILLWRGGPGVWDDNARNAQPIWWDMLTGDRLSRTMIITSEEGITQVEPLEDGRKLVEVLLPFSYDYDGFPSELILTTWVTGGDQFEFVSVFWEAPARETITLQENRRIRAQDTFRISQDANLRERLKMIPQKGLFVSPDDGDRTQKGEYRLVLRAEVPEDAEISAKLVIYGEVQGLFGTDHRRRDLGVALLWGTPVALIFGVLAAIGAQVSTFVLGAIGTWFGGKVDAVFHRLVELTMILPMLPILIVVGHLYSRSIWVMLGLIIALNVFSASMKVYRAMYLQAKTMPYFEAAQAYGAGNWRIIFRYLMPRLTPILLPQFVTVIPSFVFLEASLAVLGLGDPVLPTWGKIIFDARVNDALLMGQYYWVLQPSILLMATGIGFALVGYTLDRIFNPRLRTI